MQWHHYFLLWKPYCSDAGKEEAMQPFGFLPAVQKQMQAGIWSLWFIFLAFWDAKSCRVMKDAKRCKGIQRDALGLESTPLHPQRGAVQAVWKMPEEKRPQRVQRLRTLLVTQNTSQASLSRKDNGLEMERPMNRRVHVWIMNV